MESIDGKRIYNTIEEIVDPSHTALVVWDVQNMAVKIIFNKNEFMQNLNSLIDSARRSDIPIFYSQIHFPPIKFESSVRLYTLNKWFSQQGRVFSPPSENDLALAVKPLSEQNEVIIPKHKPSIFVGTDFEAMIRNAGITTLVFTGIATEFGIESSARDALSRDFYPVVISDSVSSGDKDSHLRSLENMKKLLTVISTKELVDHWLKSQKPHR